MEINKLRTVFFIIFLNIAFHLPAQIFNIDSTYAQRLDTIKQFGTGDTLHIALDSVYLLNENQLQHYRILMRLRKAVKDDNYNIEKIFNELITSVSNDLSKLKDLNDKMRQNADSVSGIGEKLGNKVIENVDKANGFLKTADDQLKLASERLKAADLHLEKAEALIKKEKKVRFWRNVKWAAVGFGTGFLIKSIFK